MVQRIMSLRSAEEMICSAAMPENEKEPHYMYFQCIVNYHICIFVRKYDTGVCLAFLFQMICHHEMMITHRLGRHLDGFPISGIEL